MDLEQIGDELGPIGGGWLSDAPSLTGPPLPLAPNGGSLSGQDEVLAKVSPERRSPEGAVHRTSHAHFNYMRGLFLFPQSHGNVINKKHETNSITKDNCFFREIPCPSVAKII